MANGINTVHLAYVPEGPGRGLIGAREWIPAAQIEDPAKPAVMGLPQDLAPRTKGAMLRARHPPITLRTQTDTSQPPTHQSP